MRARSLVVPLVLVALSNLALAREGHAADAVSDSALFGQYAPTGGFKVASTKDGELNIRLYTYIRYLNQQRLDAEFIDDMPPSDRSSGNGIVWARNRGRRHGDGTQAAHGRGDHRQAAGGRG